MSRQLTSISQKENIHRRAKWIERFLQKQKGKLSSENLQLLYDYNDDMIIHSMAETTRYKNLTHYGLLTDILQKDWVDVTDKDIRNLVSQIMIKHGDNGKETGYTFGLKISIKSIVRFVKLGSRAKPEDGELSMIKFIKPKKPKDKLTREDLPTDEELQKILSACADSSRDKAMLSVHAEAGTRVGELLGLTIKDFTIDKFAEIVRVKPSKISIKNLKDRWGSTTQKGEINLNSSLMKAPMSVINYVILHEVCHLKVKEHSHQFWEMMSKYMPKYEEAVKWLEVNGIRIN